MSKNNNPFTEKMTEEFQAAISAIFGSVEDEYNEKMKNNPDLQLKDLINGHDLFAIGRKMEWYICDEVKAFKKQQQEEKMPSQQITK